MDHVGNIENQAENQDAYEFSFFGISGALCARNGWSVYPQTSGTNDRRPGTWRGMPIQLRHGGACDLAMERPSPEVIMEWAAENPGHNIACVMGRGSRGAFAIDFDVEDERKARLIKGIAFRVLGRTPFIRIGNAPRFALLYRTLTWEGENRIVNLGRKFDPSHGASPGEAIEILGEGKSLTLLGRHHKTGNHFKWEQLSPVSAGPEEAPIVDGVLLGIFLDEVNREFPFLAEPCDGFEGWIWDDSTRARVPRIRLAAGLSPWVTDQETGLVIDGREAFLTRTCFRVFLENQELVAKALEGNNTAKKSLSLAAFDVFQRCVDLKDGKWPESRIRSVVTEKISRLLRKAQAGLIKPPPQDPSKRIASDRFRLPDCDVPTELRFLKPRKRRSPRGLRGMILSTGEAKDVSSLSLNTDRRAISAKLTREIETAARKFLDDVYGDRIPFDLNDEIISQKNGPPIHVLKCPPGSGKTTRLLEAILSDPRTVRPPERPDGKPWGPFIILLPTFKNIMELMERLVKDHGEGPSGLVELSGLNNNGEFMPVSLRGECGMALSAFVYRGRIRAGCRMHEKVVALMRAGKSASSLCQATVRKGQELEEIFCEHYDECPAIAQREMAAASHVVFMPHAFLRLPLPKQLLSPRAVIIDERIHPLLLHGIRLSAETLSLPRPTPRLTRKERAAGVMPEEILAEREEAAASVLRGLDAGLCPSLSLTRDFGLEKALSLVQSAARVCGHGLAKDDRIHPEISLEEIMEICEEPKGFEIREEWRFWRLLEDSLKQKMSSGEEGRPDRRFQKLSEVQPNGFSRIWIRLSWRSEPNWQDIPKLILDASAEPEIVSKIFPAPSIVLSGIGMDKGEEMNVRTVACIDRTFSQVSLVPPADADETMVLLARRNLFLVRRLVDAVSLAHGNGKILLGATKVVLARLLSDWTRPPNVDVAHFGAMRGLDAYKNHVAAISIGRLEPRIWDVDAIAASLSYDEEIPEAPFDIRGDGRSTTDPESALYYPMATRTLKMRDGTTIGVPVPEHPGKWGKIVQKQIREEEQRQFLGRLRPIHRHGAAPVWYCLSSVVPEGVVLDDVCSSNDLFDVHFLRLAEHVSANGGIVRKSFLDKERSGSPIRSLIERLCSDEHDGKRLRQLDEREFRENAMMHDVAYVLAAIPIGFEFSALCQGNKEDRLDNISPYLVQKLVQNQRTTGNTGQ